jgi:hypothetical protein
MKKKNIREDNGFDSPQSSQPSQMSQSSNNKKPTFNIKKADVPEFIKKIKGNDVNVNVMEDATKQPNKLQYLSEVKDKDGKISKPFTIKGKNYQMVRALNQNNEKVLGVCALDETDDDGNHVIYDVDEFEKGIDGELIQNEEGVVEPDAPEATTLNPVSEKESDNDKKEDHPSFAGFKHFFVNKKTYKARKFKDVAELAKAKMSDDEQYMGIKEFKKYVDETLFGSGRKQTVDEVAPTNDSGFSSDNDGIMNQKAKRLMDMIKTKIQPNIIKSISTPVAQREVIAAFAEMIGVPRRGLSQLIAGLKDISSNKPTPQQPTHSNPIQEKRIIRTLKVKDIKNVTI